VVCATPVVLVTAWSLAALVGVGFTQWVGRVIVGETFISTATLGVGLVLAVARYRTATDPISRQQLKWLAGGACISGSLAVTVWFLPGLLLGESLLPVGWLGFSGLPPHPGPGRPALQPPPLRHHPDDRRVQRPAAQQIDLDSLTAELLAVADQTMQPTQVSLWLRPQGHRRR
jgi:hypothetical protein